MPSTICRPTSHFPPFPMRISKYIGFIEKFCLFPRSLSRHTHKLASGTPTLVHVLDQGNSLYARRLGRVPFIATCHDLIAAKDALSQRTRSRSIGRWFHSRNLQALQRASTVICDSDKTLADCRIMFDPAFPLPRLTRVYVPLDPSFLTPLAVDLPPTEPFLLHVGNSARYKNRPGLFKIYSALRSILPNTPALHLYGEPLQEHERTLLAGLDLSPHVTCHARPSNEEIRVAYHQATALIFPSLEEGFGWPPLEAMACGCPVFTSNRPPLTEIGGDAAEYIEPENPTAAATLIANRLQRGSAWRTERAATGRRRAEEFSMEKFTSEMMQVYESALGRLAVPNNE